MWNTHKAVIKGVFIQSGARSKKTRTQQLDELTADIETTDSHNKSNPSPLLQSKILSLCHELCSLLLESFEKAYSKVKADTYSTGSKAGRLMALRIKGIGIKSIIPYLFHLHTSEKLLKPNYIANAFNAYYKDLYNIREGKNPLKRIFLHKLTSLPFRHNYHSSIPPSPSLKLCKQ